MHEATRECKESKNRIIAGLPDRLFLWPPVGLDSLVAAHHLVRGGGLFPNGRPSQMVQNVVFNPN